MNLIAITAAILVTQLLDWYSTRTILAKGGYEQNVVAKKGMNLLGTDGFLFAKSVAVTALSYYVGMQLIWAAVVILAIYIVVLLHNWKSMH